MKKQITLLTFLLAFVSMQAIAQDRNISGKVISTQDNLGIPGVSVTVPGTTTGTSTDIDGNFVLKVPQATKQIQFSGVGLTSEVVDLTTSDVINISMQSNIKNLNTVVV